MFDQYAWESMSFSFQLDDCHFYKNSGTPDWMINDTDYEYEYGQDEVPTLIMALHRVAPNEIGPI